MTEQHERTIQTADILVVDDSIESLKLLTEILTRAGYRVRPANGPQSALESAMGKPPDLILLDVRMPGMDGFELCRRLKLDERSREIPIIFVSGLQDTQDRVQGFEAGGVDFISKPFQEAEVLARVNTHLQLRRMQVHLEEMVAERTSELEKANNALAEEIRERKHAQHALEESEKKYRTVVEESIEGILIIQDDLRKYYNPALLDMIGYTAEQYDGVPFMSVVHPDDSAAVEQHYHNLVTGREFDVIQDFRIVTKAGETKWVSSRSTRIDWESEPATMVFLEDITERRNVQEERNRILNLSQDLICIAGMDGYFKYLNPAWERTLGYKSAELLARPFLDFIHPDDHTRNDAEIEHLTAGHQTINFENRYIRKDGSMCYVSWTATPLLEEKMIYCIGRNITERKHAEAALHESRVFTDRLIDSANVMIIGLDSQGTIQIFNPAAERITGYTHQELEGKNWFETLVPEDVYPEVQQAFEGILEGGLPQSFENPIRTKGGEERIITWRNNSIQVGEASAGILSFGVDITQRKKAEAALEESEEKFRNLVEQSPMSIQLMDPQGRITKVNQAFMALWGIPEDSLPEVLAKYNMLEDEEARERGVMPLIEKAFKGEAVVLPVIEYEAANTMNALGVDTTANKRWIQIRLYPVKNREGEVISVVEMEDDITERKLAEDKIQQYQQRLKALATQLTISEEQERRRLAADLHDHVGHGLALARMQIQAVRDAKSQIETTALLNDLSRLLLKAIQDTKTLIFDLSVPTMNEIGLAAAISEWLEEYLEQRYGLETELIDNSSDRVLDPNVRAILFRNVRELLTNVIKHARAKKVTIVLDDCEGGVRIHVKDDGQGFEPEKAFRNVSPDGGFGLFSIQERLTDLGGSLEILSEPGRGCEVIMTAPFERN